MAAGKKSFILYADWTGVFDKLPDHKAGKLIKLIFDYVNDKNPQTEDVLLQIAFEPIKQQLKRDLQEWGIIKEDRSLSGKMGNLKRWHKDLYEKVVSQEINILEAESIAKHRKISQNIAPVSPRVAKIAVTVTDTVTDTVTVCKDTPPDLSNGNLYRQPKIPTIDQVRETFANQGGTKEMADKFFELNNATGWFYKSSPIINFSNLVPGFISAWKKNNGNSNQLPDKNKMVM